MIELRTVDASLRGQVLRLAPLPDQEPYSGAAVRTLPDAEMHRERHPVTVLRDGRPVGFFILDVGPLDYAADPQAIGLRAFYIDGVHQGQGIGRGALELLPEFVRHHYPQRQRVVLTVNTVNTIAVDVYLRAGFADTGRLYLGGRLGPQHVLVLEVGANGDRGL